MQNIYLGNILSYHFVTKPMWEGMERLKENHEENMNQDLIGRERELYELDLGDAEGEEEDDNLKHFNEEL